VGSELVPLLSELAADATKAGLGAPNDLHCRWGGMRELAVVSAELASGFCLKGCRVHTVVIGEVTLSGRAQWKEGTVWKNARTRWTREGGGKTTGETLNGPRALIVVREFCG